MDEIKEVKSFGVDGDIRGAFEEINSGTYFKVEFGSNSFYPEVFKFFLSYYYVIGKKGMKFRFKKLYGKSFLNYIIIINKVYY